MVITNVPNLILCILGDEQHLIIMNGELVSLLDNSTIDCFDEMYMSRMSIDIKCFSRCIVCKILNSCDQINYSLDPTGNSHILFNLE